MRGEIELDSKVLVIRRIHVTYRGVTVPDEQREAFDRALSTHAGGCPVARSIQAAIDITTSFEDGVG